MAHRQGRVLFEVSLHWVHGFETSFMHGLGHVLAHLPVLSCPQLQRLALSDRYHDWAALTGVPRLAPRLQLGQFYGRRRLVVRVIAGMTSRCSPVTQEALGPPLGAQVECLHLPLDQQKSAAHKTGIFGDDFGNWTKILGGLLILSSNFRPSTSFAVHSSPWGTENRGLVASPGSTPGAAFTLERPRAAAGGPVRTATA